MPIAVGPRRGSRRHRGGGVGAPPTRAAGLRPYGGIVLNPAPPPGHRPLRARAFSSPGSPGAAAARSTPTPAGRLPPGSGSCDARTPTSGTIGGLPRPPPTVGARRSSARGGRLLADGVVGGPAENPIETPRASARAVARHSASSLRGARRVGGAAPAAPRDARHLGGADLGLTAVDEDGDGDGAPTPTRERRRTTRSSRAPTAARGRPVVQWCHARRGRWGDGQAPGIASAACALRHAVPVVDRMPDHNPLPGGTGTRIAPGAWRPPRLSPHAPYGAPAASCSRTGPYRPAAPCPWPTRLVGRPTS